MQRHWLAEWGMLALALVLVACSGGGKEAPIAADSQHLTVSFGDALTFDPPLLTAQAGRPVALTVKNVGAVDHDFSLADMPAKDVANKIEARHSHSAKGVIVGHPRTLGEVIIRFTPTKPGTYEFYCSVANHRDAGMKGTINVL